MYKDTQHMQLLKESLINRLQEATKRTPQEFHSSFDEYIKEAGIPVKSIFECPDADPITSPYMNEPIKKRESFFCTAARSINEITEESLHILPASDNRYIVLKIQDLNELHLQDDELEVLDTICKKVNVYRALQGKSELECIVLETNPITVKNM